MPLLFVKRPIYILYINVDSACACSGRVSERHRHLHGYHRHFLRYICHEVERKRGVGEGSLESLKKRKGGRCDRATCKQMSYLLPHLRTGWAVDQAIINEEERVVCLRFGHDHDVTCMQMDEVLAGVAEDVKNFCAVYVVDVSEVREDDGV